MLYDFVVMEPDRWVNIKMSQSSIIASRLTDNSQRKI